jgi:cysteinyl-tRNA synthetase
MLKFHNTLSGQLEAFTPLSGNEVRMYICGPTVWSFAHIGNFRAFTFGDILRRYLKYKGYAVTHVMNLTDVDDRIIGEAQKAGQTIDEFVRPYIKAFWEDLDTLGIERPDIAPRATDHIAEMIDIIEKLLAGGLAYQSEGSIYYRISAFKDYGKLSKINFAGNVSGASGRIDTDKYDKENANDFALWKLVDDDEPTGWDAPFGRGRPGWHIECSAMSMKYLGETFDLHAGGIDLMFPHHENEIAQSEGATGKLFAKYWLHGEHLKVEGETMSKSLGNFYTLRDLLDKGHAAAGIRYLLFSVPYHKQLNFTFETLRGAESTIERLRDFRKRLLEANLEEGSSDEISAHAKIALKKFEAAMDDNLNTSVALAALHDMAREINSALAGGGVKTGDRERILDAVAKMDTVFNIFGELTEEMLDADVDKLMEERASARRDRNFARSDEIRDELAARGIILEDTRDGVRWKRK